MRQDATMDALLGMIEQCSNKSLQHVIDKNERLIGELLIKMIIKSQYDKTSIDNIFHKNKSNQKQCNKNKNKNNNSNKNKSQKRDVDHNNAYDKPKSKKLFSNHLHNQHINHENNPEMIQLISIQQPPSPF